MQTPVVASLVVLLVAAGAVVVHDAPGLPPLAAPPAPGSFAPDRIARGAALARIGSCNVCHTSRHGQPLAGGRGVATPFGTVYAPNITPDPATGIGRWPEPAFRRAMREGIDREGRPLYPAFPYDHFTLVTDDDDAALYAYLMTMAPVRAAAIRNRLRFPFNLRPLIGLWKLLFFERGPFRADPSRSAEWNRGAYLVEGLGHCGACHTPRNALGAEKRDRPLAGGIADGWDAYALDAGSPAPVPWTTESLRDYLQAGWQAQHGVARGPMAGVAANLAGVPPDDVRAMAVYLAPQLRRAGRKSPRAVPSGDEAGAVLYRAACGDCHDGSRPLPFGGIDFDLSTAVNAASPRNIIDVTLRGLMPPPGEAGPMMPGFAGTLDDRQLQALLAHLRSRFSDRPSWPHVEDDIRTARRGLAQAGP